MIADVLGLGASLVLLLAAGDQFVLGVGGLATSLRVRPSVVGALIGGLGASVPELLVAGVASARGEPQLAVGSLVGSNVVNVSLALGIAALVAPVRVDSRTVRREAPISTAAVVLFAILLTGGLSPLKGVILVAGLAILVPALTSGARQSGPPDELKSEVSDFFERPKAATGLTATRVVGGLAFMALGADVLVGSATHLAGRLGLAEGFVGLTLVGLGTSTPLVAIAIQAARRGDHDLVVGNILGSNLFIALAGGGIVAFVHGGPLATVDVASAGLMAVLAIAAWVFMARGRVITRWEAAVLFLSYGVYLPLASR